VTIRQHPLHDCISNEVHARPFQKLQAPLYMVHLAVILDASRMAEAAQAAHMLAQRFGIQIEAEGSGFFFVRSDTMAVRFEPHNEFYSLTVYRFNTEAASIVDDDWTGLLPGELLSGVDILFRKAQGDAQQWCETHFNGLQLAAAEVMSGGAMLWTDFARRDDNGWVRVLVEDHSLKPFQAGRLLQRICEIETYRHMALLALPVAREVMPQITALDQQLADITHKMADQANSQASELLDELAALAAQVETLSADTANRFSAADAYFALLDTRLSELRQTRIEGLQTVTQFMERRLEPARKTCRAADVRIERLSKRIARVSELIRSQVDLSIEQQNRDLLEALNGRARRQLRLQAKLESFTIIVVTYYAFDLIERTIRNTVPADGPRDDVLMVLSFSVPLIAGVLWWYVRKLLKHYGED